jgi:hypothetical protein
LISSAVLCTYLTPDYRVRNTTLIRDDFTKDIESILKQTIATANHFLENQVQLLDLVPAEDCQEVINSFTTAVIELQSLIRFTTFKEESTCVVDTRSPFSLQLIFRHRNTHKFHQYNQYAKLKNHSVGRCVTIFSEDREIIASSARSNERRQAPGPSVNFKEETPHLAASRTSSLQVHKATIKIRASEYFLLITNGDLISEGLPSTRAQAEGKTQAERLKPQNEC